MKTSLEPGFGFFQAEDLPRILKAVVDRKEGAQAEFIEAIPLFIEKLDLQDIREKLIPFILNWIDFGNKNVAVRFASFLPYFLPQKSSPEIFLDFVFPVNELLRACAMFIAPQMMDLCIHIAHVFNSEDIECFFLSALNQLYSSLNTDAQGVALRMQSYFAPLVSEKWSNEVIQRAYSLASHKSSFIRICILESLPNLIQVSSNHEELFSNTLIPSYYHCDFRVRTHAIAATAKLAENFFKVYPDENPLLPLAEDLSWSVRFAFADQSSVFVMHSHAPDVFAKPLLVLSKDKVNQIRTLALRSLSKTVGRFTEEAIESITAVFDAGMRAQTEDIRTATIDLWSALITTHPDAQFQKYLMKSLGILGTVPIESLIYQILYKVVPLLPEDSVPVENLNKAVNTLFNSVGPQFRIAGLEVARRFVHVPHLMDFACSLTKRCLEFITAPAFNERCAAGELVIDFTNVLGWDWTRDNVLNIIVDGLKNGVVNIKKSMLRTATALLCCSPPQDIRDTLFTLMKDATKDQHEVVQRNALLCIERLSNTFHIPAE